MVAGTSVEEPCVIIPSAGDALGLLRLRECLYGAECSQTRQISDSAWSGSAFPLGTLALKTFSYMHSEVSLCCFDQERNLYTSQMFQCLREPMY